MQGFEDIIQFKIELCYLGIAKGSDRDKATRKKYRQKFHHLVNQRTLKDHSLLTYYSKAAQAFSKEEPNKGFSGFNAHYVFPIGLPHAMAGRHVRIWLHHQSL